MTRKARLLVLTSSIGQTVLLALLWGLAIPPVVRMPAGDYGLHLLGVGLMLVVINAVQGGLGVLFRWRYQARPRAELPVRILATTLFSCLCAGLVGWSAVYSRMSDPSGVAVPVAVVGFGAVVSLVMLVGTRQWLRRITARELGEDSTLGTDSRELRSRVGLQGYLLVTLLVLGSGSTALVCAFGYVQAHHEESLRRDRVAAGLGRLVARRLTSVPRARLSAKVGRMPLPLGYVLRLVGVDGAAVANAPGATSTSGEPPWRVSLSPDGRCRSRNPSVVRCRWAAVGFPHDHLRLVVLVTNIPPPRSPLLGSLLVFSLALLGFAAFVAHLMGRDSARDLDSVARRIRDVNEHRGEGIGDPIPPTTTDEVGLLLLRFGELRSWLSVELSRSQVDVDRHTALDREKALYLEEVSFALRTELTGIIGPGELLLEGAGGRLTEGQKQDVQILLDSARQLLGLVRDILDISYAEAGAIRLRPGPVDLGAVVRSEVTAAKAAREDDTVAIRVELPDDIPMLVVDEVHIRRVLANLLSNAVKFTEEGEIRVTVTLGDADLRVAVRDTGPGIAPEHQAVIFDQYRQAPQARVRQQRGSGLGLAIARELVRLHGGALGLESEPGEGSEFWFTLPRRPVEATPSNDGEEPEP